MRKSIASSLMVLGMATALFTAFKAAPAFSEPPGDGEETEGAPHMVFEETEHDFGVMGPQQTVKHNFKFRNEGNATLIIEDIKTTCGCTGTLLSNKEISPGEEGNIEVSFRSGASGGQKKKSIMVHSNDPQQPDSRLYINAKVIIPVEVRPRVMYWVAERNKASMRTVELLYQPDLSLNIQGLEFSSAAFSATVKPKNDIESPGYDIRLHYDGSLPIGNFQETLTILTDNPRHQKLKVGLRGKVAGPVKVIPAAVSLGAIEDDVFPKRIIHVYATDKEDFEITEVISTNPIVSADVAKEGASSRYKVEVTLTAKPPQGAFSEKLFIRTNYPAENPIEVPVHAYVK